MDPGMHGGEVIPFIGWPCVLMFIDDSGVIVEPVAGDMHGPAPVEPPPGIPDMATEGEVTLVPIGTVDVIMLDEKD